MTTKQMTEAEMVHLVRNALLVAGKEMGEQGDHWPAIKSTIHGVMKDWEDLQIERNVHAELKKHLYAELNKMEMALATCSAKDRADAAPKLKQLREIYDAHFAPVDAGKLVLSEEDKPAHVKRAEVIINSLEADDE